MSSSEIDELKNHLRLHNGDLEKMKKVMSKIMANVYVGKDMSPLFPDIVLQARVKESSIRRLIGMFTAQYGHLHPDTALLCINQLTKEIMHDTDPLQRGHALQTLGSLNIPDLAEYIAPPIKLALQDSSPYVRRLAVDGCVKINNINNDIFDEQMLFLHLEDMVDDFDESVASIAITALIQTKPDYKMKSASAMKLLKRLNDFSDWQVPLILAGIDAENLCSNESEVMDVLNLIDGYLDDCSPSVVLHIVNILQPIISSLKSNEMDKQFIERVKKPLMFRVKHSNPEISYWFCLQIPKIISNVSILSADYKTFFPAYYDPAYLKAEKIRVLSMVVNKQNVSRTVHELLECLKSPKHGDISQDLVQCVTLCVLNHGDTMSNLIVQLASLLQSSSGTIISTLLPCIEKIVLSLEDCAQVVLPQLHHCAEFELTSDANVALLSMLGSYGNILPECVSMLYCYVEEYDNLDINVRNVLLTACMKQFDLQGMAGITRKLLALVEKDNNPLIKGRANIYSNIIINKLNSTLNSGTRQHISVSTEPAVTLNDYPISSSLKQPKIRETEEVLHVEKPIQETLGKVNLLEIDDLLVTANPTQQSNKSNSLDDIFGLNIPVSQGSNAGTSNNSDAHKTIPVPTIDDELSAIFGPSPIVNPKKQPNNNEAQSVKNFIMTLSCTSLQPEIYEQNWGKNWKPEKFKTNLSDTTISVSVDLQAVFLQHSISTMAITPPTVDPQQIFLYSNSAGMLVLLKILLSFVNNTFEVEVRAANYMISQMMIKSVRHIIGV